MALFLLEHVNFAGIIHYPQMEIPAGKTTFICGESGCGKSTMLKLLNGILSSAEGEILYEGKEINSYDALELRRRVLLVSQAVFLFDKTIQENFDAYYGYRELEPIGGDAINGYLRICAVDFPPDAQCGSMSGGEKQRIFIAICLSLRPEVLMLDEPTSALDDQNAHAVLTNIKGFCAENHMSLLVVSHNNALAQTFADYTIQLGGGETV